MLLKKNEVGLTLVEILATITIFSIIAIIVWNFLFKSLDFGDREITQNQLQQEANLIVHTIQNLHTKSTILEFVNINNTAESSITIKAEDKNGSTITKIFNRKDIKYEIKNSTEFPSSDSEFSTELTLTSKKNEKIYFKSQTTYSKLSSNP